MFGSTKIDNYIDNSFEDSIVGRKKHLFKISWHVWISFVTFLFNLRVCLKEKGKIKEINLVKKGFKIIIEVFRLLTLSSISIPLKF